MATELFSLSVVGRTSHGLNLAIFSSSYPRKTLPMARMAKHQDAWPGNDLARAGLALGAGMS